LLAYRHEGNEHVVEELLEMGYQGARPRQTSGLAEQQRLFRKLRR